MLPSRKLLSLPIISLKEGEQIGFVRNLVIDPRARAVAALIVDPKGFFKEQWIIPFNRVVNIGENAITLSTQNQVEKATNLPDILELLKEKTSIIGIKVITTNGKNIGMVDEFYLNPDNGNITSLDISSGKIEGLFNGKAKLAANEILTIGSDVIVVAKDCEERLEVFSKGINDNVKSLVHSASSKVAAQGQKLNSFIKIKRKRNGDDADPEEAVFSEASYETETDVSTESIDPAEPIDSTEPTDSKSE